MLQLVADAFEYILIFTIIIGFGSPYAHAVNRDYFLTEITATAIVVILFLKVKKINKKIIKKYIMYFIPYILLIIIYMSMRVESEFIFGFAARFVVILPFCSLVFCHYIEIKKPMALLNKYVNIMVTISVISLFFWLFGSQLHVIKPSGYLLVHWGANWKISSYYGLYFESQNAVMFGLDLGMRNQGMFCEGPMYSLNLVLSIALNLFFFTKNESGNRIKQVILIITLLTTFTTTGLILLIIIYLFKYLINRQIKGNLSKFFAFTVVVPIGFVLAYSIFLDKSTSGSWLQRVDDFSAGMLAWLKNPILGNGWNENETVIGFMSGFRSNTGFSNSIMMVLAQGGIVLFSLYMIPLLYTIIKSLIIRDYNMSAFVIIFILEFIFTTFAYSLLMLFFLSYFICYTITKENIRAINVRSAKYKLVFR